MELGQNIDLINQHKLYLSNKVLKIYSDSISINDTISSIIDYSKKEHSFIILNKVEIINESEYFEAICNLLKSLPNEIYIMQSTLTNHIYSVVPLLNFIQWKHRYMRNVPTDTIDTVKMFPNYMFEESMIPFHTYANTQIPNDQASFADFCYGGMVSGKEGNDFALLQNAPRLGSITGQN